MRSRTAWTIPVLVVVLIVIALMRFDLTALREPGSLETSVANWGTHFLIRRASRQGIPPRPLDTKASIASGSTLYTSTCGFCHGPDGRAQTPIGQWTYPRAADLTSKRVQGYSDQELFWIIQNGIRFTGMPAFAKVVTPDHIWDLVNYVRTLPSALRKEQSTNSTQTPGTFRGRRSEPEALGGARRTERAKSDRIYLSTSYSCPNELRLIVSGPVLARQTLRRKSEPPHIRLSWRHLKVRVSRES